LINAVMHVIRAEEMASLTRPGDAMAWGPGHLDG
jgi:hypothetical protein